MPGEESSVDAALLGLLLQARGPMTLHAIGQALGLDVVSTTARVESLRRHGCRLDAHPQRGVELLEAGLGCWTDYIEHHHTEGLGRRVTVYRETASTQTAAREVVESELGDLHGRVILADHQSAGRGRLGRRWLAEPGVGLLMTVIVRRDRATPDRLVIGSCCAVAEAIESLGGGRGDR
ncbi:MAG: hypothetical protein ACYTGQ_14230, partial [Planctomycetota bacterium]